MKPFDICLAIAVVAFFLGAMFDSKVGAAVALVVGGIGFAFLLREPADRSDDDRY